MLGIGETWLDFLVDTKGAERCYVDIAAFKARRMTEPLQMVTLSREQELELVHAIAEWRKERGDAEGYVLAMGRLSDLLGQT